MWTVSLCYVFGIGSKFFPQYCAPLNIDGISYTTPNTSRPLKQFLLDSADESLAD